MDKIKLASAPTKQSFAAPVPFFARADELNIEVDGFKISAQAWGVASSPNKILCVHGFQDNSNTFFKFQGQLAEKCKAHVVAIDLPGHGRSDRFAKMNFYHYIDYVMVVGMVVDALGWDEFAICGHSMGSQISAGVAAGLGSRVTRCALLEGYGPTSIPAALAADFLKRGMEDRRTLTMRAPRIFPSLEVTSKIRAGLPPDGPAPSVGMRDGATYRIGPINYDSAAQLMGRGMTKAGDNAVGEKNQHAVMVTQDPKVTGSNLQAFSDEQVEALFAGISAPIFGVIAENGIPMPHNMHQRLDANPGARFQIVSGTKENPARHHFHVDLNFDDWGKPLLDFLSNPKAPVSQEFVSATKSAKEIQDAYASNAAKAKAKL